MQWCITSLVHHQWPRLAQALLERGLIPDLLVSIVPRVNASLAVASQGACSDKAVISKVSLVANTSGRKLRFTKRRFVLVPHHCQQCGSAEHNVSTCPESTQNQHQRLAVSAAYVRAGQEARKLASDKYTNKRQKTHAYANRPHNRMRAPQARCFLQWCRAPPCVFARWCVEDGLLKDLAGTACPKAQCGGHIGRMVGVRTVDFGADAMVVDVSRDTVCHRCKECRARYAVSWNQPLFADVGHGGYSMSYRVLGFQGWCEGKSLTTIARDLNVHNKQASQWIDKALAIVENDMLARQSKMVFGKRGSLTTDVEVDETCLQMWSVHEPEQEPTHFFFVVLGIRQRGDMSKFWLRFVAQSDDLPLGITSSQGIHRRVPPVSQDFWLACSRDAFHEDSNLIQHSDSARLHHCHSNRCR